MNPIIKSVTVNGVEAVRIPNAASNDDISRRHHFDPSENDSLVREENNLTEKANSPKEWSIEDIPEGLMEELSSYFDVQKTNGITAEIEQKYEKGFEKGMQEGKDKAVELNAKEFQEQVEENYLRVDDLMIEIKKEFSVYQKTLTENFEQLVMEAVCKVIAKEYVRPKVIASVVNKVIKQAGNMEVEKISINPSDLKLLSIEGNSQFDQYSFKVDDDIQIGGCIVESMGGTFDGQLKTQLLQLDKAINKSRLKAIGKYTPNV